MGSYGGSQTWYSTEQENTDKRLHRFGCGVIAVGDILLYLDREHHFSSDLIQNLCYPQNNFSQDVYLDYIRFLNRTYIHVLPRFGTFIPGLIVALNRYFIRYSIPIRARYLFFSTKNSMLHKLQNMLGDNLPVILCIGANFPCLWGKKGVTFYQPESSDKGQRYVPSGNNHVNRHFVTITGILYPDSPEESVMLEISSWGDKYYINYDELRHYILHDSLQGITTIIQLRKKR